mgnify:CR=1 FL=1
MKYDQYGQTYTTSQSGVTNTSTNAAGCTHTQTLNLTINGITAQPVGPKLCTTAGSTASVSVTTNVTSPLYTWQFRVVTATSTPDWTAITSANAGTVYTNFTTSTLGIRRTTTTTPCASSVSQAASPAASRRSRASCARGTASPSSTPTRSREKRHGPGGGAIAAWCELLETTPHNQSSTQPHANWTARPSRAWLLPTRSPENA